MHCLLAVLREPFATLSVFSHLMLSNVPGSIHKAMRHRRVRNCTALYATPTENTRGSPGFAAQTLPPLGMTGDRPTLNGDVVAYLIVP